MTVQRTLVLAAAALLTAAAGSASAAVALNGQVATHVSASAGDNSASDAHHDNWTGSPSGLSTSATATAASDLSGVTSGAVMAAHWASANAGSVTANMGWTVASETGLGNGADLTDPTTADWSYQFTAANADTFNLSFQLQGTGDTLGLGSWDLLVADNTAGTLDRVPLNTDFSATTNPTGSSQEDLFGGHTYTVSLFNNDSFTSGPIIFARTSAQPTFPGTGSESDQFTWSITGDGGLNGGGGVPEPSTWALAITGFGLSGAALRRRRIVAA